MKRAQGVLHRRIGGAEVMHEQLGHLLEMTQRPVFSCRSSIRNA
ncbi:Scr1 family TA system antitoxin-like transcriptional regulator [Nonomuraea lactucae]